MKKKFLFFAALLLFIAFALLRLLPWIVAGLLVLGAISWATRKRK